MNVVIIISIDIIKKKHKKWLDVERSVSRELYVHNDHRILIMFDGDVLGCSKTYYFVHSPGNYCQFNAYTNIQANNFQKCVWKIKNFIFFIRKFKVVTNEHLLLFIYSRFLH